MATAQMTRDLMTQVETYLSDTFEDTLPETGRQKVVQWLCSKIDEERRGWKQKLQLAFKEVEKERKLALAVHSTIQRLNSKFDQYNIPGYMNREPSMYHGADKEERVSNIDGLEKSVDALVDSLNYSQEERIECFQYLQFQDESCNLADVIRRKINRLEEQLKKYELEGPETEQRLNKEIQHLSDALDMQTKLNTEESDRHSKEVLEMRKLIGTLRSKVNLTGRSRSDDVTKSIYKTSYSNKSCQADFAKPSRECCIQVSMDLTGNHKANGNHGNGTSPQNTDVDIMDMIPSDSFDSSDDQQPIKGVTIIHQNNKNKTSKIGGKFNSFKETFGTEKSRSLLSGTNSQASTRSPRLNGDEIKAPKYQLSKIKPSGGNFGVSNGYKAEYLGSRRSYRNLDLSPQVTYEHRAEQLRGQVVELATKLDDAKIKADQYQEQLAMMRLKNLEATNEDVTSADNGDGVKKNNQYTSRSIHDFRPEELQGFLSGIKVKDNENNSNNTPDGTSTTATKTNSKVTHGKPSKALMAYNGTAKCLRCNTLYKIKDNNKSACRYHSKNKHKIEKYDSRGKLQKIFYFWECCMQSAEAIGCKSGEHV